ncbi:MAG: hypothetical protein HYW25_01730 [Candidatus Aenigmarchaeota archaeon]|nr:hypothetical protein [Candidatus Aenigmarchaeota archaeon]
MEEERTSMKKSSLILIVTIAALAVGAAAGIGTMAVLQPGITGNTAIQTTAPGTQSESGSEAAASGTYGHVHALALLPESRVLLMGSHNGLYRSMDEGATWAKVDVRGDVNAGDFMSLVLDPRDENIIYAGGHDLGVIKSTDGGNTWVRWDSGISGTDIHGFTINQRNPDLHLAYSVGYGVFRSTDGGKTWKRMDDGPENPGVRSLGYLAVQTSMDKSMGWDNWGLLLAGTSGGLYSSFSCFCGWTKVTEEFDDSTIFALANVQADLRTLYAGTKDGIFKSTDEGASWRKLDGRGPIAGIAINPSSPGVVYAVDESGLVLKTTDGGNMWMVL